MKIKARFSNLKGKKQVFSRKEVLLKIFLSSSKKKRKKIAHKSWGKNTQKSPWKEKKKMSKKLVTKKKLTKMTNDEKIFKELIKIFWLEIKKHEKLKKKLSSLWILF